MYIVYIISSRIRRYLYVGLTRRWPERFLEHQKGKEKTTSPYRPFRVLGTESFQTRKEARQREKYLKSGIGKEWIKSSLNK